MIDFEIELSEAMRARIAVSATPEADEAKAKQLTTELVKELLSGTFSPRKRDSLLAAIEEGAVDAAAMMTFERTNREVVREPVLHRLIDSLSGELPAENRIVKALLKQASPNLEGEFGIPAFFIAFERWNNEYGHYPAPWNACVEDGRMDLEHVFRVTVGFESEWQGKLTPPMTMANMVCFQRQVLMRSGDNRYRDQGLVMLMQYDPVVDPAYADIPELKIHRRKWQREFDQLKQAIAEGDEARVQQLVNGNAVAHAFSLGRGEEVASEAFWGALGDAGVRALLELPDWVQARLRGPIELMLQAFPLVPGNQIEQWQVTLPDQQPQKTR